MKRHYYLFSSGTLRRKENSLFLDHALVEDEQSDPDRSYLEEVVPNESEEASSGCYIPIQTVESLFCFGELRFSANILRFLGKSSVPMHIFDYYGNYASTFYPREEVLSGLLVVEQVKAHLDADRRLAIARELVISSLSNADLTLAYYEHRGKDVMLRRMRLREMIEDSASATGLKRVMGCEGYGRRQYYESWPAIVAPLAFSGRSSNPPGDPINAVISFTHALLYATATSELYRTGLHPLVSYLHEPAERRFSLSLDIADVFKSIIADRLVFSLFNTSVLREQDHFIRRDGGCYLNESGRRITVKAFDEKMRTTFEHRQLGRSISYRQLIQHECTKLKTALHDGQKYSAFRGWW